MKICLYAIAKNEIKEVDAWYESMKEADEIIVLDTGSTDGTPERLRELGVTVYEKTYPKPFPVFRRFHIDYQLYYSCLLPMCFFLQIT